MSILVQNDVASEVNEKIEQALKQDAESLSLANLCLRDLPSSLFSLQSVRNLDISDNPIGDLPVELAALKSLESLTANDCGLLKVPAWLKDCPSLKRLTLSTNLISELNLEPNQLQNIEALDLSHNLLTVLPDWLSELGSLREFDVSFNYIIRPPEIISEWLRERQPNKFPKSDKWFSLIDPLASYGEKQSGKPGMGSDAYLQKSILKIRESIKELEIPKLEKLFDRYKDATCAQLSYSIDGASTQVKKEISEHMEPLISALPNFWNTTREQAVEQMNERWSNAESEVGTKTKEHQKEVEQITEKFSTCIDDRKRRDTDEVSDLIKDSSCQDLIKDSSCQIKMKIQNFLNKARELCRDREIACQNSDRAFEKYCDELLNEIHSVDDEEQKKIKSIATQKNESFTQTCEATIEKIVDPVKLQVADDKKISIQYLDDCTQVVLSSWEHLSKSLKSQEPMQGLLLRRFWVNKKSFRESIKEVQSQAENQLSSDCNNTISNLNKVTRQNLSDTCERYKSTSQTGLNEALDQLKTNHLDKESHFENNFEVHYTKVKETTKTAISKIKKLEFKWKKFITSIGSEVTLPDAYNNLWDYLSEKTSNNREVYIHTLSRMERLAAEIMVQEGRVIIDVDENGCRKLEPCWSLQSVAETIPSLEQHLKWNKLPKRLLRLLRNICLPIWTLAYFLRNRGSQVTRSKSERPMDK